jgi:drug/metabolite transporter (DMT)-like permease
VTTIEAASPTQTRGARLIGLCGVASLALLAASLLWAHHWGPLADTIVAAWAISSLASGAGASALYSRGVRGIGIRIATIAAATAVLSLVVAGIAYAAGSDPAAGCGGG